nr:MKRN2 opposite strand protein isoform X2 [Camelus dromedarius]
MQRTEAGQPIIKFNHCQKPIYSFSVPRCCPLCQRDMGARKLGEAPVSIANPFTNGHREKCSFLLRPTQGTFLREYDGRSDLHVGITNTNGDSLQGKTRAMHPQEVPAGERRARPGRRGCDQAPQVKSDESPSYSLEAGEIDTVNRNLGLVLNSGNGTNGRICAHLCQQKFVADLRTQDRPLCKKRTSASTRGDDCPSACCGLCPLRRP